MHSEGLAGKTETFLRYGVTRRFEAGFGYLWKQNIVRPLASYTLLLENRERPSLTMGLMYDSLGGGRQGTFLSAAKDLYRPLGIPASVYIGGALITNERDIRFIVGSNLYFTRWLNASVQYDGKYANVGVTVRAGSIGNAPVRLGIVAAKGNRFGPLVAINIPLGR
jgi:hypothetical protein